MKINFNKFIIALAPMAGVTDLAFRKICADFGADMVVSEMISVKALEHNSKASEKMLREESKSIRAVQLFGHDKDSLINVISSNLLKNFDIIDFNCGCPAPKIVKNNDGSAMMRDIEKTKEIISALVRFSNKPVSVKFRLGIDGVENYIEFGKMCEQAGVSFITLHARTREQGYSGSVDKNAYKKLVESVKIPVFWSGDIKTKEDVEYAKSIGCAGVMIGRNAIGNPEIFSTLKEINPPYTKKDVAKTHLEMLKTYFKTERTLVAYFKKHLMWYVKSTKNVTLLKQQILQFSTLQQLESIIEKMD